MANLTDNCTAKKAKKKVIKRDLYKRVEVIGTGASGVIGELFYPKATTTLVPSETITLTVV